MAQTYLELTEELEAKFFYRDAEASIVAEVTVDEEDSTPACSNRPSCDFADGSDKCLVRERESSRPFRRVAGRHSEAESRQDWDPSSFRSVATNILDDAGVRVNGQMGAVLFGGSDGK